MLADDETPLPLPLTGPATLAAVKVMLGIDADDEADDLAIEPVVGAVNIVVGRLPIADRARGAESWSAEVLHGANMLAARIYRRKDSPAGVATFGDYGPVYVQRNDPDVAMLLEIGAYASPAVG